MYQSSFIFFREFTFNFVIIRFTSFYHYIFENYLTSLNKNI